MIIINVLNCDGVEVKFCYKNLSALQDEWYKEEEMPDIPMLDDQLVYAEVDGVVVDGDTCADLFNYLQCVYGWNY